MNYRENIKNGDKLSALGFGVMRLPYKTKQGKDIDEDEAIRILRLAYESGVNYFDTAYVYYDGESEKVLGKAVAPFRKEIKLATKLPTFSLKSADEFEKLFNTSLERLGTDYIDYYLLHCLLTYNKYMQFKEMGIWDWLVAKKAEGKIRNIGFSFHGSYDDFVQIIDESDWDFCQIQYNYYDEMFQAGTRGLKYAHSKGIPVVIMEPLRGGALVNRLPEKAQKVFKASNPERSFADWGLRWVWNHPEVTLLLSGMGSEEMVRGNLETANTSAVNALSDEELQVYSDVLKALAKSERIPCTGCGYCLPCPKGVDIRACFSAYNGKDFVKRFKSISDYVASLGGLTGKPGFASQCVECHACEKKCPQHLEIPKELKKVKSYFEIPLLKTGLKIARKVKKF